MDADLSNRWVHFRIRDVYMPDPEKVLRELYGDDLLQGRVVDLTDGGDRPRTFAVVEVEGLGDPLIIPIDRILGRL